MRRRHTTRVRHTTTPPPHTLMMMTMMMVMLVVVVAMVTPANGHNGELCVVETPLHTPYISAHHHTPVPCHSCTYPRHTPATPTTPAEITQVHIIDVVAGVVGVVEVVVVEEEAVVGRGRVVVVLATPPSTVVEFRVHPPPQSAAVGNVTTTEYLFVVSKETKIEVVDLRHKIVYHTTSTTTTTTTQDLISATKVQFGFLSSHTRVAAASVNHITLHIDDGGGGGGCSDGGAADDDGVVEVESSVVECAVVEEVAVSGCFHHSMLGGGDRDIHIIEVTNINRSIVVELIGGGGGGGVAGNVVRNVTLVLRAGHHPTYWHLLTRHLQGTVTLLVGGEDQVENTSVPGVPGVALQVRRVQLPASFDQLILSVLTSIGPPASYTRANATTHLSLMVAAQTDNHIEFSPHLTNYDTPTVYAEDPASIIRGGLSVVCGAAAMTLALPYGVAARVGGVAMALLDRACVGSRNGTHIVLRAEFTKCKFTTAAAAAAAAGGGGGGGGGGKVVYSNLLSVELGPPLSDDEDLAGSGYGADDDDDDYYPSSLPSLRVSCEVWGQASSPPLAPLTPPRLPQTPPPPQHNVHYLGKAPPSSSVRGASYTFTLFEDRSLSRRIVTTPATPATPTPVTLHTRLYAQAALASVLPRDDTTATTTTTTTDNLRVVLEECWVSNSTTPTTTTTTTTTTTLLLRKSCRVHPSVTVDSPYAHSHAPTFSFKVLPEYGELDTFYLHCQVGLCSPDTLPRPSVIRCIEPALYCSKRALLRVFDGQPASSSLQTLTLGPLTLAATTKSALLGGVTGSSEGVSRGGTGAVGGGGGGGRGKKITKEKEEEEKEEEKKKIVVVRGLSTEVVVGIAVASFFIGVCLTATLWVIHMKTDPRRQKRADSSAPRNSGYDLSAHSGSSTPSSQAPMTA